MKQRKFLNVADIGIREYSFVFNLQKELQLKRQNNEIPDTLILVEHPPVYTIGKNGARTNVIASESFLKDNHIDVVETDRGGDVTYHGPGQIVGYPIIDLNQHKPSVSWYVDTLEALLIGVVQLYGITATAGRKDRGVWVGDQKIAAIGIRIAKWVTIHGFALNVNINFDHYQGIIACGLTESGVTSMERECGKTIDIEKVKKDIIAQFKRHFGYTEIL